MNDGIVSFYLLVVEGKFINEYNAYQLKYIYFIFQLSTFAI